MPSKIEEIGDRCMSSQKSLSLPHRFEPTHPSLSNSGSLMGLLCPVVGIVTIEEEKSSKSRRAYALKKSRRSIPGSL
jgi:hypothetical protein